MNKKLLLAAILGVVLVAIYFFGYNEGGVNTQPEPKELSFNYKAIEKTVDGNTVVTLTSKSKTELKEAIRKEGGSALEKITDLNSLEKLDLSGTNLSDISTLSELDNLEKIIFANTDVSDLSPVSDLNKLIKLDLDGCPVKDLSPISELPNLRTLDIDNTQVSDLSPVSSLESLSWIEFRGTSVSDVSPLYGLKGLDFVGLQRSNVSNQQCEELKNKLPEAEIKCS